MDLSTLSDREILERTTSQLEAMLRDLREVRRRASADYQRWSRGDHRCSDRGMAAASLTFRHRNRDTWRGVWRARQDVHAGSSQLS